MQQVKLFKSIEAEITDLEKDVNQWIRESGVKVISIEGNIAPQTPARSGATSPGRFSPSDIMLIVLYEASE